MIWTSTEFRKQFWSRRVKIQDLQSSHSYESSKDHFLKDSMIRNHNSTENSYFPDYFNAKVSISIKISKVVHPANVDQWERKTLLWIKRTHIMDQNTITAIVRIYDNILKAIGS